MGDMEWPAAQATETSHGRRADEPEDHAARCSKDGWANGSASRLSRLSHSTSNASGHQSLTKQNYGFDCRRSGHWTVRASDVGSAVDLRWEEALCAPNFPASDHDVEAHNAPRLGRSVVERLAKASTEERKTKEVNGSDSDFSPKGFYIPKVDTRGIRVISSSGQQEVILPPKIHQPPAAATKTKHAAQPQPNGDIKRDSPPASAKLEKPASVSSHGSQKNKRGVRILGKNGEQAFVEFPVMGPGLSQPVSPRAEERSSGRKQATPEQEEAAAKAKRDSHAANAAKQLREERLLQEEQKRAEDAQLAARALMSGALPDSPKATPPRLARGPAKLSGKASRMDSGGFFDNPSEPPSVPSSRTFVAKLQQNVASMRDDDSSVRSNPSHHSDTPPSNGCNLGKDIDRFKSNPRSSPQGSKGWKQNESPAQNMGAAQSWGAGGAWSKASSKDKAAPSNIQFAASNDGWGEFEPHNHDADAPRGWALGNGWSPPERSWQNGNTAQAWASSEKRDQIELRKSEGTLPQGRDSVTAWTKPVLRTQSSPLRYRLPDVKEEKTEKGADFFQNKANDGSRNHPRGSLSPEEQKFGCRQNNPYQDPMPNLSRTIFAGRGWISPHPLSEAPSEFKEPPQPVIRIPSANGMQGGAAMTYEEWKALQRHGSPPVADEKLAPASVRRNWSRSSSAAPGYAGGSWGQRDVKDGLAEIMAVGGNGDRQRKKGLYQPPTVRSERSDGTYEHDFGGGDELGGPAW